MKTKKNAAKAVSTPESNFIAESPAKVTSAAKAATSTTATGEITTIDIKMDVGFGNAVYLRGKGAGLNWERGVQCTCVDGKTWRWSGKVKDAVTFKPLINDKVWSVGNDITVKPGQKLEIKPTFA